MKKLALLILGGSLLTFVACDQPNDPNDSDGQSALFTGVVSAYNGCGGPVVGPGVRVDIPELGLSVLTDDSGRFSFRTNNVQRYYSIKLSKAGYYIARNNIGASFSEDSGHYIMGRMEVYKVFDYSSEFVEPMEYIRAYQQTYRDTSYLDQNGVLVTKYLVEDSIDASQYRFKLVGIDEQGRKTNAVMPRLLWSRSPNIDPTDSSTYTESVWEYSGIDATYAVIHLPAYTLANNGLKAGDKIYVAGTGVGRCGEGFKYGKKRSEVQEVVVR
jgi:hypothetical protein